MKAFPQVLASRIPQRKTDTDSGIRCSHQPSGFYLIVGCYRRSMEALGMYGAPLALVGKKLLLRMLALANSYSASDVRYIRDYINTS
jgi:hypothetical protein